MGSRSLLLIGSALRQGVALLAVVEVIELLTCAQQIHAVAHVLAGALPLGQVGDADPVGVGEEGGGHLFGHGEAVELALGEHVPDHHQQFPGHSYAGLHLPATGFDSLVDFFPVRVAANGDASGLDHGPAQVAAAVADQLAAGAGLAALVAAAVQTGVADQLPGGGEAGDIADGGQNGHGQGDGHTGQLDEQRDAVVRSSQLGQLFIQGLLLLSGEVEGRQVGERHGFFERRYGQFFPEGAVLGRESVAFGGMQVVAVEDVLQAGLGFTGQLAHLVALGDERPQLTHFLRWDPDTGQQAGGVQPGQDAGRDAVVHDLGAGDQGHVRRVDDGDGMDVRLQRVVDFPGIGRHFDDDGILGSEMAHDPGLEVGPEDLAGAEKLLLVAVHADGHKELLVDVETDETLWGRGLFWGRHVNYSFRMSREPRRTADGRSENPNAAKGAGRDLEGQRVYTLIRSRATRFARCMEFGCTEHPPQDLRVTPTMQTVQQAVKHDSGLEQRAALAASTIRLPTGPYVAAPGRRSCCLATKGYPPPGLPGGDCEASLATALFNVQHALNSPITLYDPSGHRTCSPEQVASGDETCDENITDSGDEGVTIHLEDLDLPPKDPSVDPPNVDIWDTETRTSEEGQEFIESWEDRRNTPYNDSDGNCTAGVGHMLHQGGCSPYEIGRVYTDEIIEAWFQGDVMEAERAVRAVFQQVDNDLRPNEPPGNPTPLTQKQFDALVSVTFNVGAGNLAAMVYSTGLSHGDYDQAGVTKYMLEELSGGGPGVVIRRHQELDLFYSGVYGPGP